MPYQHANGIDLYYDALNIPSAHVIGSSARGPISLTFAAIYPQRVRSLTLAGTGTDLFPVDAPVSNLIRLAWGEALAKLVTTARIHIISTGGHSLVHRLVEGRRAVIDFIREAEQ